jgi:beta-glucosidase
MRRRLRALTTGGIAVACSLAIGASAGASTGSDRAATASHPNASLRAMTPAQRAAVSPHLAFARPGAVIHASANAGATANAANCPWLNTSLPVDRRVSMLEAKMTLADRLDLMEGHNGDATNGAIGDTHAIPSLCVPEVTQQDGPAGVADGVSGATQLPAPVNDAATWDRSAAKQYGQVLGNEEWTKGNMVVYAPTINIDRDPRWGRNFESLSEDPLLTGTLGASEIKGIQSQGPIAQVKHYAIYNNETNRNTSADDVVIDARTMHEIYLPAFYDTAIKGGAGSVMCSYSSPNGTFACQNQPLLSILEQRWGYKGWVGSDYGAVHDPIPSVNAGLDQEQGSQLFGPVLQPAVLDGQIPMSTIDAAAERVLFEMFKHGFFNRQPPGNESTNASTAAHVAFTQQNSEEGTVLLKDSGSILPLSSAGTSSIAVIGADGTSDPETAGGGSAAVNPTGSVVSPLAGITARAGSGVTVSSYSGTTPADAAATARGAKVAVVFANNFESEGSDLQNITLQNNQNQLISAVARANPHTIVVLNTGGPVTMPWLSDVQGVLEAWYPGQQDGAAIASVLFGDTNPSGHLPETFPASLAQAPTAAAARFPGVNGKVQYSDKLEVGYRYYDTENVTPLFPFGFGLSYTSFKYSGLKLSAKHVKNTTSGPDAGQGSTELTVTANVTNTGSRAGADVAQLYLGDPASTGEPARQLEGFRRVMLKPGESKTVTFPLSGHALSFFDTNADGWVLPTGDFTAYVGDSSATENLPLSKSFTVTKSVGARTETLSAPASVGPESTFTATATFSNDGDFPLTGVSSKLALPAGWSAKAQSAVPAKVAAHGSLTESWTVTVPASAQGTTGTLTASISGSTKGGAATKVASATQQVSVEPVIEATAPPAPLIDPGQSTTLSVSLTNRLPDGVTVTLAPQPPTGVTVTPSPDTLTIPGDGTATATFTVSATAAGSGNQKIPLAITANDGSATFTVAPAELSVNVAFGSLAASFDNTGISDESAPFTSASFDGSNQSFSEEQLTTAGFGPGATFTHDGIPYTWPSAAAGTPDNVVGAGQAIQISGQGSMLGVLGASNNGNATGPVTVIYTDGTQTTGQVTLNDWYSNAEPAPGDILVTTPNWDHSPAQGPHAVSVYAQSIPIDPTKTVADVILPSSTTELSTASAPFHVFALGIGTPPAAGSARSTQAKGG